MWSFSIFNWIFFWFIEKHETFQFKENEMQDHVLEENYNSIKYIISFVILFY